MAVTAPSRPEVPLQVITPDDVRASVRRAKKGLEAAASEIVWQIEMEGWRTLGYSSWGAMREAEYGSAAFMVPNKNRLTQLRAASAPSDRDEPSAAKLASLATAAQQLDVITREAVAASRDAGLSWSQIGAALGVSKQAAQQRYGNA